MEPVPNPEGLSLRKLPVHRYPSVTRLVSLAPRKVCRSAVRTLSNSFPGELYGPSVIEAFRGPLWQAHGGLHELHRFFFREIRGRIFQFAI